MTKLRSAEINYCLLFSQVCYAYFPPHNFVTMCTEYIILLDPIFMIYYITENLPEEGIFIKELNFQLGGTVTLDIRGEKPKYQYSTKPGLEFSNTKNNPKED